MKHRYGWLKIAALIAVIGIAGASAQRSARMSFGEPPSADQAGPRFETHKVANGNIRYVAVGDSYSCGTGATPRQSWPAVLTRDLRAHGVKIDLAANLGVAGWTTNQALEMEMPVFHQQTPDFATLMIGVNDTYRGTTAEDFRSKLRLLIDQMQSVLPDKTKILLVTIPDYTVTPSGRNYAADVGAAKVVAFNAIIQEEGVKYGLPVVDVYPLSQKMAGASDLTARDGLHPSAKEYALWEKHIYPAVAKMLQKKF